LGWSSPYPQTYQQEKPSNQISNKLSRNTT
jgi:hypothetical protein